MSEFLMTVFASALGTIIGIVALFITMDKADWR